MSRFLPHQGLFLYISPGLFFFLFNFFSFQPDYHSYHGYQNYNYHYNISRAFFLRFRWMRRNLALTVKG
jgi:hypothetical protein